MGAGAGIDAALITVLLGAPWKAPGCPCGGAPRYTPQCWAAFMDGAAAANLAAKLPVDCDPAREPLKLDMGALFWKKLRDP